MWLQPQPALLQYTNEPATHKWNINLTQIIRNCETTFPPFQLNKEAETQW